MSNTLGTTYVNLIWPEALSLLYTVRPELSLFTTDFNNTEAAYGSSIVTRTHAVATVGDFGTGAIDRADADKTVTLNQHKEVHAAFTVAEYSGAVNRNLVRESAEPFAVAIANSMVDAIAALTATGFTANEQTMPNAWDYEWLVDVRKVLQDAGVPEFGRYLLANSTVYATLLKDERIVDALRNPANEMAIKEGKLPKVAGLIIAEYPALPTTNNMVAFAGTKDALLVASRVQTDPRAMAGGLSYPGTYAVISNPQGFSVTVNEWVAPADNTVNTRMSWMYGVDEGNTSCGFPIVTA
jgi:hypothetical protein